MNNKCQLYLKTNHCARVKTIITKNKLLIVTVRNIDCHISRICKNCLHFEITYQNNLSILAISFEYRKRRDLRLRRPQFENENRRRQCSRRKISSVAANQISRASSAGNQAGSGNLGSRIPFISPDPSMKIVARFRNEHREPSLR